MTMPIAQHFERLSCSLRNAEIANDVRAALRSHLYKIDLNEQDHDALHDGIVLIERALAAESSSNVEQRTSHSFAGDAMVLRILKGATTDPAQNLRNIHRVLKAVHEGDEIGKGDVEQAIEIFIRMNRRALESFRTTQEGLSPRRIL